MKDFTRDNLWFSLCGLNCGLCPMKLDGYCPGCGGGEGNQSCKAANLLDLEDLKTVMEHLAEEKSWKTLH